MSSLDSADIKNIAIHPYGSFKIIFPQHKCSLQVSRYVMAQDYKFLRTYFDTYPNNNEYEYNYECRDINNIIEYIQTVNLNFSMWNDHLMDKLRFFEHFELDIELVIGNLMLGFNQDFDLFLNKIININPYNHLTNCEIPMNIQNDQSPKLLSEFLKKQYIILFKLVDFYTTIKADKIVKVCYKRIMDTWKQFEKCYFLNTAGQICFNFYKQIWAEIQKNPIFIEARKEYYKHYI